jgi:hypothetical protein
MSDFVDRLDSIQREQHENRELLKRLEKRLGRLELNKVNIVSYFNQVLLYLTIKK